jgi:hypothetical protein
MSMVWGCSSEIERFPTVSGALGSISSTKNAKLKVKNAKFKGEYGGNVMYSCMKMEK